MKRDEPIGGVVIFLLGAATVYLSLRMEIGSLRAAGSGLFPLCLGVLLMLLSGLFVLRSLLSGEGAKRMIRSVDSVWAGHVTAFLGTMALATLLLDQLGYPLMSLLMLLALLRILGVKKWVWNAILSCTAAGVSYALFVQWLKIPLPKGWIGL